MKDVDVPSRPEFECSLALAHTRFIPLITSVFSTLKSLSGGVKGHLYANGNIWEDPQVNFRSLYLLDFSFNDLLSGLELLGSKPDSVALYTKTPFAISESCAFDGTSDGYWNDTLVSFDVFDLPRSELVSEPSTQDRG